MEWSLALDRREADEPAELRSAMASCESIDQDRKGGLRSPQAYKRSGEDTAARGIVMCTIRLCLAWEDGCVGWKRSRRWRKAGGV